MIRINWKIHGMLRRIGDFRVSCSAGPCVNVDRVHSLVGMLPSIPTLEELVASREEELPNLTTLVLSQAVPFLYTRRKTPWYRGSELWANLTNMRSRVHLLGYRARATQADLTLPESKLEELADNVCVCMPTGRLLAHRLPLGDE